MAENYKHLYGQTKKMLDMYQDEIVPAFRKTIEEMEKNRVEIPCKIGDEVWGIKKFNHGVKVCKGTVYQMYIIEDMKLSIVVKGVGCGEWGRNIFATKEEAEEKIRKLQDRRNNDGR